MPRQRPSDSPQGTLPLADAQLPNRAEGDDGWLKEAEVGGNAPAGTADPLAPKRARKGQVKGKATESRRGSY